MLHTTNGTDQFTHFTFLPGTFRFGADPQLTVITAYLEITPELHNTITHRRTKLQTEDPTAVIVAYDIEYASLQMYCIAHDTQCLIRLHNTELTELHQSLTKATLTIYHDTPENLLNDKRKKMRLPRLSVRETAQTSPLRSSIAT